MKYKPKHSTLAKIWGRTGENAVFPVTPSKAGHGVPISGFLMTFPGSELRWVSIGIWLVAFVARMTWETSAALGGNPWVTAAIAWVVGCVIHKLKAEHPDAHDGHLSSFYGTYSIPNTIQRANWIWLLLHAALRAQVQSDTVEPTTATLLPPGTFF